MNERPEEILAEYKINLDEWEKERQTFKWKYIECPFWATIRFFENFKPRHIKWSFQKVFRGFSDSDLWGLDCAIAKKVLPMLKAYRNIKRAGIPNIMFDGPINDKEDYSEEEYKKANDKWNEIIDKMIYSFTYVLYEDDKKYSEYLGIEYEEGSTWKRTKECYSKTEKRYLEGMKLFAEYFHSLWD